MIKAKPCQVWTEKLVAPEDLSLAEREAFDAHVVSCSKCTASYNEYVQLRNRIQALPAVKSLIETTSVFLWHDAQLKRYESTAVVSFWRKWFLGSFAQNMRVSVAFLIALSFMIVSITLFQSFHYIHPTSSGPGIYDSAKSGSKNPTFLCQLPAHKVSTCAGQYTGTIHNTTSNITTTMVFFMQQQQRTISGYCTIHPPLSISGSILGNIDTNGEFDFIIHDSQNVLALHFTGTTFSDGSIRGRYTTSDYQVGVWSVSSS
jgi:hypothetical protein